MGGYFTRGTFFRIAEGMGNGTADAVSGGREWASAVSVSGSTELTEVRTGMGSGEESFEF